MVFEEIYKEYGSKVYRLCLGYTNDSDWAKDLTQDTFIQVWTNLKKFRGDASVGTWIFRIAANNCLRQLDVQKKIQKVPLPLDLKYESDSADNELLEVLKLCIAGLEKTERLLISMVLEEQPYPDIASILGITEGNLRVRVHRIKQTITEKFRDYERI